MKKIDLKSTFVSDIALSNKPKSPKISLQQKFTYNVKYTSSNLCRADLSCIITSPDNDEFKISFTYVGIFEFDPSLSRVDVHKLSYLSLFPFAKAFCVNLTTACSMPPIYLSQIDVDSQEIYRIDLGGFKK